MRTTRTMLSFFTVTAVLFVGLEGCDKNPTGSEQKDVTETNLFPFAADRKLVYNQYTLDATTGLKVAGSDHRATIHVGSSVTHLGRTAFMMIDSTYTTGGTVGSVDTTYAAVENGNLYIDLGGAWGLLFNRTRGTETEYSVGSYTDNSLGFPLTVNVSAIIRNKAAVETPGGTFSAYKVDFTGVVSVGGNTFLFPQAYYFADGVGIVRTTTPPTTDPQSGVKVPGDEMLFVSKNF